MIFLQRHGESNEKSMTNPWKNPSEKSQHTLHKPIRTRVAILETRSGPGGETMGREGRGVGKMATSVWRLKLQDLGRFSRMICVKNLSRTNFLFDHQWVSPECRSVEF